MLRRQEYALLQSTTPFASALWNSPPQYGRNRVHGNGVVLYERACFFLRSAYIYTYIYDRLPLLRTLLRTSIPTETLTTRLLRALPRSTSFQEPSKNASKSRVLLHNLTLPDLQRIL